MVDDVLINDAELKYCNFDGRPSLYQKEGVRSFVVVLEPSLASKMSHDGWNVKTLSSKTGTIFILVVYMEAVTELLEVFPESLDLVLYPYSWSRDGKSGIKAFLKASNFTV